MRTILIIEDDPHVRAELSEILRHEGFRVVFGEDGSEGLALTRRERPDLVLCGAELPGLDGFGVLRALRTDPVLAPTPVLLLGARKADVDLQRCLDLEADGYLTRPVEIAALVSAITAALPSPGGAG